jgi:hypothetical protein
MSCKLLITCRWWLVVSVLFALPQFSSANNAPVISGAYQLVQNTNLGSQTQIRMRIHLMNHGSRNLSIQSVTLWDFSHPEKGGTHSCVLTLHAHASVETTQEFTIRRPEFESWKKGLRPRLVLEMTTPTHTKSTAVVRLDPIAGQEAR